jgi:uncharacterized heparinase superfamily protein
MSDASLFPLEPPFAPLGVPVERRDRGGLRRIRDTRFAELAYRGWQEAARWLDHVAPPELPDHPDALLGRQAPDLADAHAIRHMLCAAAPARFFTGAERPDALTALFEREPDARDRIIAAADALLDHRFDPPWNPHRHQWLVRAAQARVLTGDERYAEACVRAVDGWLHAHSTASAAPWTSSLDVALRILAWCWTLMLLRDSPAVTNAWLQRVLAAIWLHATHVRRHLSYSCARSTELIGGALGLFYAGTLFREFRDADRWRDVAFQLLVAECDAQVCRDGVHFERSTCYHRYAIDGYLHFLLLARRNGIPVPDHVAVRVQQMIEFLLAIRQPDGTIPALGDDDGGSLLPLAVRHSGDARGVFGVGGALFERRDFNWAAGGTVPDAAWLLGADALANVDRLGAAPPPQHASRVFPSGGYASMRSGWELDAHHAIIDIGPIGCPVSGGHGHADLLSIQCSIFGEPCLVDAGTYSYAESPWRDFFRSTAAHSTVVVDGASQAAAAGPFGWRGQPRVRLREWHSTPEFDFLDAEHDGYLALPDPVVHRRRVIFVKPGYWILVDDVTGAARHQVDLTFQFGALAVSLGAHPWARAATRQGRVLWICPFPGAPVQPSLKYGELTPIRGWISTEYGDRQPAPMLIYSFVVALPWRIVTLLLPDRQGLAAPPAVRAIYDDAGRPTGLAFERPRRLVRFDDHAVCVERE